MTKNSNSAGIGKQMKSSETYSRRNLVKMIGLGGVAALAGCSGESEGSNSLQIGAAQLAQNLNPMLQTTSEGYITSAWMYSNLVMVDSNLETQPDLATDWEANGDATQWTFTLRDDATFHHNGNTVLAEDVKTTFQYAADEETGSTGAGSLSMVDSVEIVNDNEVQFSLQKPYSDFPKLLGKYWARILPKNVLENDFDSIPQNDYGSGPFVLDDFQEESKVELSAYDDYYKTDEEGNQLPYIDELTLIFQPESETRVNSLLNGETQLMNQAPATQFDRLDQNPDADMLEVPSGWYYPILMDTTWEPLDDHRVRHAMKFAVNREEILTGAREGRGVTGQDTPMSPAHEFHVELDDKFGPEANTETANELLEEAGYGGGIEIDEPLYAPVSHDPPIRATAVLFQEQMANIGIEFEIQEVTWDRFLSEIETQKPFYVSTYTFQALEDTSLRNILNKDGFFYQNNWHEGEPDAYQRFMDHLDAAEATTDPDERQENYRVCEEVVRDRAGMIVPFFKTALAAKRPSVKDFEVEPTEKKVILEQTSIDN